MKIDVNITVVAKNLESLGFTRKKIQEILGINYRQVDFLLNKNKKATQSARRDVADRILNGESSYLIAREYDVTPACINRWVRECKNQIKPKQPA